uniref:Uncharacterized protein n=1 Tax=Ascaris lumbricoides TaxID=6252 RepID=A0A0M3HUB9_ASCLU
MSRSVAETAEEETCAGPQSTSSGRVRNLALRFERTSSRSPNSFRKAQRRRLGQLTVDSEKKMENGDFDAFFWKINDAKRNLILR